MPGSIVSMGAADLALSPDCRRVAFIEGEWTAGNVVVRDLATGVDTRLTFNKADDNEGVASMTLAPAWFPTTIASCT